MKNFYQTFFWGLCFLCSITSFAQPVNQTGFEGFNDESVFTQASWIKEGFTVPWVDGFNQSRAYVDDAFAHSGNKSLRILYPKGGFGPSETGAQAPLKVPGANEYYISYWLRFAPNFSYGTTSQGGKLPGLGSGDNCSGCTTCTGTNGFSARLMWRTNGKAVLYLYDMDKKASCGDDHLLKTPSNTDFYFQKGTWHRVIERVKINTASNHDGEVEVWMDGKQAILLKNLQFVSNGDKVNNLYFSTFHGGSTEEWAPTVDSYIWFDDVVISTNASDIFLPTAVTEDKTGTLFHISPQPVVSGGWLKIEGTPNENRNVEIFDNLGNRVSQGMLNDKLEYQLPRIAKGTYLLRWGTDQHRAKILIE